MKELKAWFYKVMNTPRPYKPTRQEEAILELASYLEDPNHDQYKVHKHIADILGVTFIKDKN